MRVSGPLCPLQDKEALLGVDLKWPMRFVCLQKLTEHLIRKCPTVQIEIFRGEENMVTLNQTHSKMFHCTYLLHYYPFDTQVTLYIIYQCL